VRISVVGYYVKDSCLIQSNIIRGSTGMPSVTIIVSAGSEWSSMQSFEWKEKRNNLDVKRITEKYGICR
jgi:hypothetical protein